MQSVQQSNLAAHVRRLLGIVQEFTVDMQQTRSSEFQGYFEHQKTQLQKDVVAQLEEGFLTVLDRYAQPNLGQVIQNKCSEYRERMQKTINKFYEEMIGQRCQPQGRESRPSAMDFASGFGSGAGTKVYVSEQDPDVWDLEPDEEFQPEVKLNTGLGVAPQTQTTPSQAIGNSLFAEASFTPISLYVEDDATVISSESTKTAKFKVEAAVDIKNAAVKDMLKNDMMSEKGDSDDDGPIPPDPTPGPRHYFSVIPDENILSGFAVANDRLVTFSTGEKHPKLDLTALSKLSKGYNLGVGRDFKDPKKLLLHIWDPNDKKALGQELQLAGTNLSANNVPLGLSDDVSKVFYLKLEPASYEMQLWCWDQSTNNKKQWKTWLHPEGVLKQVWLRSEEVSDDPEQPIPILALAVVEHTSSNSKPYRRFYLGRSSDYAEPGKPANLALLPLPNCDPKSQESLSHGDLLDLRTRNNLLSWILSSKAHDHSSLIMLNPDHPGLQWTIDLGPKIHTAQLVHADFCCRLRRGVVVVCVRGKWKAWVLGDPRCVKPGDKSVARTVALQGKEPVVKNMEYVTSKVTKMSDGKLEGKTIFISASGADVKEVTWSLIFNNEIEQ